MSGGVGDRLAAIRKALGETQKTMGTRMGVGTNTWPSLERDGRLPKTETLIKIAEAGFSIDWLVTGEGVMKRSVLAEKQVSAPATNNSVTLTADATLWREMAIATFSIFKEEHVDFSRLEPEKFAEIVDAMTELEAQERASPDWRPSVPSQRSTAVKPNLLRRFARLFLS
uniref:helix-turn-helix domain-containing protein n=1 Tax=Azospirillum argentinense TaxID=2970906 RepID=UPI0010C08D11|nr:helix-turn-helix transcriptional regulator [Azospirillum argentinense]